MNDVFITSPPSSCNKKDIETHLLALFGTAILADIDGQIEIRCLSEHKTPMSRQFPLKNCAGITDAVLFAEAMSQRGYNSYVVNSLKKNNIISPASDNHILCVVACFIDCDDGRELCDLLDPPADFAVRTGTFPSLRKHYYWLLQEPCYDLVEWRRIQKALAAKYGTDKAVCNPSRLMRLAGTIAHPSIDKRKRGYQSELTRFEPEWMIGHDLTTFQRLFPGSVEAVQGDTMTFVDDGCGQVPLLVVAAALSNIPPVCDHGIASRNTWLDIVNCVKDANSNARGLLDIWQKAGAYSPSDDRVWDTVHPAANSYIGLFRHAKSHNPKWWQDDPVVRQWWIANVERLRDAAEAHLTPMQKLQAKLQRELEWKRNKNLKNFKPGVV